MKIESKKDMKKRGVKSPDFADAAWYACAQLTERELSTLSNGGIYHQPIDDIPTSWGPMELQYSW